MVAKINGVDGLQVEYYEIADAQTLQPVTDYRPGRTMGFVAVRVGQVRLIDNIEY